MDIKRGVIQPIGEVSALTMEGIQEILPISEISLQPIPILGDIQNGDGETQPSTSATGNRRSGTVHGRSGNEGGGATEEGELNGLHAGDEAGRVRGGDPGE